MIWSLPLLPAITGLALWSWLGVKSHHAHLRRALGGASSAVLFATLGLAVWTTASDSTSTIEWSTILRPSLDALHEAGIVAVLIPAVALPVVTYAAFHEPSEGLARQVGLVVSFVGAMELLVLSADLLTLIVGWELVSALSWALIAHQWRDAEKPRAAAHAFNVTKLGSLGLFVAAGAALAEGGSLAFEGLSSVEGAWSHALVAGVVIAAASKSAQLPFSPWLYSAMAGPTPVSALLHSATMVAAGAYLLIRLHDALRLVGWFQPVTIALGAATALAGGLAAILQSHVKKLLAASTSAQHGLMFVAAGAGYPAAALVHLATHALFKAQLFLVAGLAISTAGTEELRSMRLRRIAPLVAGMSVVGASALAGVPPLGAAWSKEKIVASAGHYAGWLSALVVVAGALSALYAARFQLLAFGPGRGDGHVPPKLDAPKLAVGALAASTLLSSLLWVPGAGDLVADLTGTPLPQTKAWETALSLILVALAVYMAWRYERRGRLERVDVARPEVPAGWYGIPTLTRIAVVEPSLRLARAAAAFDRRVVDRGAVVAASTGRGLSRVSSGVAESSLDRVVGAVVAGARALAQGSSLVWEVILDRSVEGLGRATGFAARDVGRTQTGLVHHYYVYVIAGVAVLVATAALWR